MTKFPTPFCLNIQSGKTALHYASENGNLEIVKHVISVQRDTIGQVDNVGFALLCALCSMNTILHRRAVTLFIGHQSKVNKMW